MKRQRRSSHARRVTQGRKQGRARWDSLVKQIRKVLPAGRTYTADEIDAAVNQIRK